MQITPIRYEFVNQTGQDLAVEAKQVGVNKIRVVISRRELRSDAGIILPNDREVPHGSEIA